MIAAALILLCTLFRVVPHPANVAPVGATAVLAGRTLRPIVAIAITLAAMAVGDVVLARIHGWPAFSAETLFVYGGFATQVGIAHALRRVRGGAILAALAGATAFFLISNFGLWALGMYPRTAAGLAEDYTAALPFFERTLVGDVAWTIALALAWQSLVRREQRLAHAV